VRTATTAGRVLAEVDVTSAELDPELVVQYALSGIGFAAAERPRVARTTRAIASSSHSPSSDLPLLILTLWQLQFKSG